MDPFEEIKETFFQECDEQLAELEGGLQAMKDGDGDDDTVNAVFRAVHSIKGGAGAFGLEELVRFAHTFESVLDEVRGGRLAPDADLLNLMLTSSDMLADHVRAARGGEPADPERSHSLVEQLDARRLGGGAAAPQASAPAAGRGPVLTPGVSEDGGIEGFDFTPVAIAIDDDEEPAADEEPLPIDVAALAAEAGLAAEAEAEVEAEAEEAPGTTWIIRFRPKASLYSSANEPAVQLRELARLGTMTARLEAGALPLLEDMEPEESYLSWTITLTTESGLDDIAEIFEFVEDDCDLEIVEAAGDAARADEFDVPEPEADADAKPKPKPRTRRPTSRR